MKYLIEAVDTYNPKLRTRDNTSLRFEQYLLVFVQTGMVKETRDYEYEKHTAEIFEVKAELEEEYGRENVTDNMLAETLLDRTLDAMKNKTKELFKNRPFYGIIRDEIIKCRDEWVKELLASQSYLKNEFKTKANRLRAYVEEKLYSKEYSEAREKLIEITKFQIRKVCTKFQTFGSYDAITEFDIQTYDFDDGESLEPVGDGYVSEGVYLERKEPFSKETEADEKYQDEIERTEGSFLKVDLNTVLASLSERGEKAIRIKFGLGLKKEDVADGEKLVKNYEFLGKTIRKLRHPSRTIRLKNYFNDGSQFRLKRTHIGKKNKTNTMNYDDSISFDIASGDLENVKLSEIITSDELFNHLNESGLWCLNDLVQMTEEQLKTDLECTDEFVDDIKRILSGYGLELSEEEQIDIAAINGESASQRKKVKTLKGLMAQRKKQEEEIGYLEEAMQDAQNLGERED